MSTPSKRICPLEASIIRNNAWKNELLPAPVRPQTPIYEINYSIEDETFCNGLNNKLIPFRTGGRPGRYDTTKSLISTSPVEGQFWSGIVGPLRLASWGKSIYSFHQTKEWV